MEDSLAPRTTVHGGPTRRADVIEMPQAMGSLERFFRDQAWTVARRLDACRLDGAAAFVRAAEMSAFTRHTPSV